MQAMQLIGMGMFADAKLLQNIYKYIPTSGTYCWAFRRKCKHLECSALAPCVCIPKYGLANYTLAKITTTVFHNFSKKLSKTHQTNICSNNV